MDCGYLVTSIDNINDYWDKDMINRHVHIIHDDIKETAIIEQFDFVTCVSVLEHIQNHEAAVHNMFNLVAKSGYIALTFPYNENQYIENVYKLEGSGYDQNSQYICKVFSRNEVDNWLKYGGRIVEQEYWQVFSGDLWTFGERLYPPRQVDIQGKHQLTCILIQKNNCFESTT